MKVIGIPGQIRWIPACKIRDVETDRCASKHWSAGIPHVTQQSVGRGPRGHRSCRPRNWIGVRTYIVDKNTGAQLSFGQHGPPTKSQVNRVVCGIQYRCNWRPVRHLVVDLEYVSAVYSCIDRRAPRGHFVCECAITPPSLDVRNILIPRVDDRTNRRQIAEEIE